MSHNNIKDTRLLLTRWGNYWRKQEMGLGYASKSPTLKLKETLELGCASPGTTHLVSHMSMSIFEPEELRQVSEVLEKLKPEFVSAIRTRYVLKEKISGFHVREAENEIMLLL